MDIGEALRILEGDPSFRILRKVGAPPKCLATDGDRTLAVVDCETTGLSIGTDVPVEIAVLLLRYEIKSGRVVGTCGGGSWLQDPGRPLDPAITELTGISDADLAGKAFDRAAIEGMVGSADLVLAHKACFDRPMLEGVSPVFVHKPWACSMSQIEWRKEGVRGAKLDYLLASRGLFHDGHRAMADCEAVAALLSMPLPKSGTPALSALLAAARLEGRQIWAVDAPYSKKVALKARGYEWCSDPKPFERKAWWREVPVSDYVDEIVWLELEVYDRGMPADVRAVTAYERFSLRSGASVAVMRKAA